MSNSKSGHVLYLMIHLPFIWWVKVGITSKTADVRAKQVDRAVWGKPRVIMAVWIPGAYLIEQDLHRRFSWLNQRFYKGDGSTEWFLFPVAFVVLPFMLAIWAGYVAALDLILGTQFFEMGVEVGRLVFAWIVYLFEKIF